MTSELLNVILGMVSGEAWRSGRDLGITVSVDYDGCWSKLILGLMCPTSMFRACRMMIWEIPFFFFFKWSWNSDFNSTCWWKELGQGGGQKKSKSQKWVKVYRKKGEVYMIRREEEMDTSFQFLLNIRLDKIILICYITLY